MVRPADGEDIERRCHWTATSHAIDQDRPMDILRWICTSSDVMQSDMGLFEICLMRECVFVSVH